MREKPANTADEAESGGGDTTSGLDVAVGPSAFGVGASGGQASGSVLEVGDGVAGVVGVLGVVGGVAAPGVAETVMASFWPDWQWEPKLHM